MRPRALHVLHLVPSLDTGGLENGLVNVAGRADPERVRHTIVCLESRGAFADRLPPAVRVEVLGKPPGLAPGALARLARRAAALGPDVVHSRNWATLVEGAIAARAAGARHVHGLHGRTASELVATPLRRRAIERLLLARADRVVALLPSLRDEARALGARDDRLRVIENGVDVERFRPDAAVREASRAQLGLGPRDVVVGCVARLDPVKDHGTLLRAFARLASADRRAVLLLVGEGPLRASLEGLARVDGIATRLRFLGQRQDVERVYPALDVFALASRYEGASNTVLEAMACGLPVVATAVGGTPELLSRGGGRLVPAGDAGALGAALVALARDQSARHAAGRAARAVAEARSLDGMVRRYEALYVETCGPRPSRVRSLVAALRRAPALAKEAA